MTAIKLNELTLENVAQWPLAIKYTLIALSAALIASLGYVFLIQPNIELSNSLLIKEKLLKVDFETKQQLAANLTAYKDQLRIMNERFGIMLKELPTQNEMPGLLEDISKTGIASGLTFELFAPMPEVMHDFYIELPINIKVVGNYQQLAVFLSRVAEMNRIVTLHDFDITVVPDNKQNTTNEEQRPSGELLQMELTAKIYRYRVQ